MSPRPIILAALLLAGCSDPPPATSTPVSSLDYIKSQRDFFCYYKSAPLPAEQITVAKRLFEGLCVVSEIGHESAAQIFAATEKEDSPDLYAFTVYQDLILDYLEPIAVGPFVSPSDCHNTEAIARQYNLITAPCQPVQAPSACELGFHDLAACRRLYSLPPS
jgi:hypothetical protein